MLAPFGLLSAFQVIREEFFTETAQQIYRLSKIRLPEWSWERWALVAMVILCLMILEGAYREITRNGKNKTARTTPLPDEARSALTERLEVAMHDGNTLLAAIVAQTDQFSLTGAADSGMNQRFHEWTQGVYGYLKQHLPEYASDFLSPNPRTTNIFGPTLQNLAETVRIRQRNLREILHVLRVP